MDTDEAQAAGHGVKRWVPKQAEISWPNFIPILIGHGLALLALVPAFYTTAGLCAFLFFTIVIAPIGINLCYHRMLTHRGLRVPKWLEHLFVVFAVCCLEGPPGQWVATHRAHHKHSDREHDPHSPRQSLFWAHIGWLLFETPNPAPVMIYARDVLQDPFYRWLQGQFVWAWIFLAHALLIFGGGVGFGLATGEGIGPAFTLGFSLLVWGVFLRSVFVWHVTWSVNSFAHWAGYRNYDVRDDSRNNPWVALFTNGEGWHNNHHADPSSCCNTHRPWELDLTFWYIKLLHWLGLAHDLVLPRFKRQAARRSAQMKPPNRAAA